MPPEIEHTEYELVEANQKKSSSSSSSDSITLSWQNISYSVTVDKENKSILHPMNGVAYPGELLAIMGSSGAGKSTLLDILAGRLVSSRDLHGTITTNGSLMDKDSFRKQSGYVMQSDALFPLLSVRETIRYAAYLRCTGSVAEQDAAAENTIKLLRLEDCADTIVGDNDNRGISGGQKRRVSVAVDIIHSPSVIFLDEPTSGLDSSTALSVVESLKELASSRGCTIVMTIHQPSARLFNLIDKVLFLAQGRVTYNGPVSALNASINNIYLEGKLGNVPFGNQPEIFLDLCDQLIVENRLEIVTSKYESIDKTIVDGKDELLKASYANSFINEIAVLVSRGQLNVRRTPELFFARLGASTGFGIMIGTLFLFTPNTLTGIQHRMSYFVFIVAFFYYTSLEALPIFLTEREIFQREYSRGAYRALSYTIAQTIVSWPFMLLVATWFSCITYWLVGLPNYPAIFFFHVFTVFTILVAGSSFATAISTVIPNAMTGQTAGSALLSIMFLFSGFFIKTSDIPDYWIYLHYLSLFKYAFDSLIINDLYGVTVVENGYTILDNNALLKLYSVDNISYGRGVGVLWLFIIFFRTVFWYRLSTAFNGSRK